MTPARALIGLALVACGPQVPTVEPRAIAPDAAPAPDAAQVDAALPPAADAGPDATPAIVCADVTLEVGAAPLGYRATGRRCAGVREGTWRFTNLDGGPLRDGDYAAGLETGPWRFWYRSGKPQATGSYAGGQRVGTWTWWHGNGKPSAEGTFDAGLRHGVWREWHDNGQLAEDRRYDHSKRDGTVLRWDRDGRLQHVRTCVADVCTRVCQVTGKKTCPPPPAPATP